MHQAHINTLCDRLMDLMRKAEPDRFGDLSDEMMQSQVNISDAVERIIAHHRQITDTLGRMYADVGMKLTPVQRDLSIFRSQPYLQNLEIIMNELHDCKVVSVTPTLPEPEPEA